MNLDDFARMTDAVINQGGFEDFLPTVYCPASGDLHTLVGLPPTIDPEPAVLEWASQDAGPNKDFIVAFKIDESHYKIIKRAEKKTEQKIFAVDER